MDTRKGDVEGRHDMKTLSMLGCLQGIAVGGMWLRGEVSWYQDGNRGASCKVSFILPFLWCFFLSSPFRRNHEIMGAN